MLLSLIVYSFSHGAITPVVSSPSTVYVIIPVNIYKKVQYAGLTIDMEPNWSTIENTVTPTLAYTVR